MKYLLAFLLVTPAFGQVTYNYTSAPLAFTGTVGAQPTTTSVTGSITLAQALNPNQANQIATPQSFYYNFAGNLDGTPFLPPIFVFSTVNGVITDWYISLDLQDGVKITSSGGGDRFEAPPAVLEPCSFNGNCIDIIGTNTTAGVWAAEGDPPPPSMQAQLTSANAQLDAANAQIASLQKQLTHVTSEMEVYRQGVVTYEAEFLAWESRAYYCQAHQGKC